MRALTALLLAGCLARIAAADPAADYERAFRRGNELFDGGRWGAARAEYEAAYAIDPRPILLFNIASTYRREGDRVNARLHYQRYLDDAGADAPLGAIARKTIADIDAEMLGTAPRQAPPPLAAPPPRYPRPILERPLTLPAGMVAVAAGVATATYEAATADGELVTGYQTYALAGGAVGLTERIEAMGELALSGGGHTLLFAQTTARLVRGQIELGARIGAVFSFQSSSLYDLRLGVPARIALAPRVALIAVDDVAQVAFDPGDTDLVLRLPVGVAYQVSQAVYAALGVSLVEVELTEPTARAVARGVATIGVVPMRTLDIVAQLRASSDRSEGAMFVRLRL
jgi:hypothetical protein